MAKDKLDKDASINCGRVKSADSRLVINDDCVVKILLLPLWPFCGRLSLRWSINYFQ